MILIGPQPQFDKCPGIWNRLRLPSLVGLVALQCSLGGGIPFSGRLAFHIVFANQGLLNLVGALRIDRLLSALSWSLLRS